MSGRSVAARFVGVAVALVGLIIPGAAGASRAGEPVPRVAATATDDAMVFIPYSGAPAIARLGDQQATIPVPKFKYTQPVTGHFDGSGGAGIFVYGGGDGKPSGILRVRRVNGLLQLSFRKEVVNGQYTTEVGDFDGNGITDILWMPQCCQPGRPYIWYFHANATHTSVAVDFGSHAWFDQWIEEADLNKDGVDDLIWVWDSEAWLMKKSGGHTVKALPDFPMTDLNSVVPGDLGPAESTHPTRLSVEYRINGEDLLTFDTAGNHTTKTVRPPTDVCCDAGRSFAGRFREGRADSLFRYSYASPGRTEFMEDFDADGTSHRVAVHQVSGAYYARVGDFDGNGFDDILWYSRTGRSSMWSSDGTHFSYTTPPGIPLSSRPFVVHLSPG